MDYIKLYRQILDWEWYRNINTCRLFIHMLLKAYWKDTKIEGKMIPRGSFVSSYRKLADETNLTPDEVRTAVKNLISTKEITKQAYSKYTVFTVNNYDAYQNVPSNFPSNSQPIPTLFPTNEEYKEGKNIKKEVPKGTKKKFEPPSVDDVRAYCLERGNGIDPEYFVDFYKSKDWMIGKNKMKDWKAAVRNWEKMNRLESKTGSVNKRKNKFDFETKQNYEDLAELEKQLLSN